MGIISKHSWVRYFARRIDYFFGSFLIGILLPVGFVGTLLLLFSWIFIEAYLLSIWGTTPGKWLLKTTVRDSAGKPTFSKALNRSFSVWWKRLAIGFPIITTFTLFFAYNRLVREGITTWDREGGFVISHDKIGNLRVFIASLIIISEFVLLVIAR